MKRFLVSAAVTLLLASAWSDGASAQRHKFLNELAVTAAGTSNSPH
jgi:hypothetical protein